MSENHTIELKDSTYKIMVKACEISKIDNKHLVDLAINDFVKKLNKKLFHRRTDIQLEVLPFKETSASQNIHFHLLLKNPQEHINNKKIDFEEICRSVLRTMKFVDKVNTSNPETLKELDFIKENYRNPTFYCLKESCQINDLPLVCDLMYYQR